MRLFTIASSLLALATGLSAMPAAPRSNTKLAPKIVIISMFLPEGELWYGIKEFNLLAQNITINGLSPLFPDVHCTSDGEICQVITGESEINAAATITALVQSGVFNLTKSYFFIAGIGGVNPNVATIGGVSFARYAVQVALQYEIDPRELPSNFSTGYFPQGSYAPNQYPSSIYGTEVFEVNDALRKKVVSFAQTAKLNDSAASVAYRSLYTQAVARSPPAIFECDVATSDVYYSGKILSDTFANTTKLLTNGTGIYCATAQEDNATLEALTRAAKDKLVDFSRIIVMRTFSDFDQPPPGENALFNLRYANQGAFLPAIANIYLAGIKVIEGILSGWNSEFEAGIKPTNYIGDIFATLGGTPDFGPGGASFAPFEKRSKPVRSKNYFRRFTQTA